MAGPLAAPLIAAGAALGGSVINQIGAANRARKQHQYNKQLAEYSFSKQQEMWENAWNKETAYNDPRAQMERLQKAGINPHMAYSSGGVQNVASSGTLPQYNQQTVEQPPTAAMAFGTALQDIVGNAMQLTQLGLARAQIKKANAEAKVSEVLAEKESAEWLTRKPEFSKYSDTFAHIINGRAYAGYADTEAGRQRTIERLKNETELTNMFSDTGLKRLQAEGMVSENEVKQFKGWLAKNKIDPDGSGWMSTLIREVQKLGVDAGVSPRKLLVALIKRIVN